MCWSPDGASGLGAGIGALPTTRPTGNSVERCEREFEIIGEALNRLARLDPSVAERIAGLPRIVGFRNRIIHGYDTVDDATVWGIIQGHLGALLAECEALLREAGGAV